MFTYKIFHFTKDVTNDTNKQLTYYNEILKSTNQSVENIKNNKLQEKKYNIVVIYDENLHGHRDKHDFVTSYKSLLFFFMNSYILYYYYKKM